MSDFFKNQSVRTGIKMGLPIMIGYLPLGFAYGVLAVKNGIGAYWAIAMSVFVFAGAGQFIAAGMIGAGASIISIIIANCMINLRHVLMAAALVTPWKPLPTFWKNFLSFFQTDEVFASNISYVKAGGVVSVAQILSCSLVAHFGWIFGSALGAFSGDLVTDVRPLGLDFALPSMFIALLVPFCLERISIFVAIFAAMLSLFFIYCGFGRWSIILATILAASLGLYLFQKKHKICEINKTENFEENISG